MENFLTIAPPTSKDGAALCAATLQQRGIILSPAEQAALAAAQTKALRDSGRVEFGAGILPALAKAFANSPYITQENAAALLEELQAAFYYSAANATGLYPTKSWWTLCAGNLTVRRAATWATFPEHRWSGFVPG